MHRLQTMNAHVSSNPYATLPCLVQVVEPQDVAEHPGAEAAQVHTLELTCKTGEETCCTVGSNAHMSQATTNPLHRCFMPNMQGGILPRKLRRSIPESMTCKKWCAGNSLCALSALGGCAHCRRWLKQGILLPKLHKFIP